MDKSKIGEMFKSARKSLGLTQKEVADKAHINQSRYSNYENAYSTPSTEMFVKLSEILGIDYSDFVDDWMNYRSELDYKDFSKGFKYQVEQLMFADELYQFQNFVDSIEDKTLRRELANIFSMYLDSIGAFVTFLCNHDYNKEIGSWEIGTKEGIEKELEKLNEINKKLVDVLIKIEEKGVYIHPLEWIHR